MFEELSTDTFEVRVAKPTRHDRINIMFNQTDNAVGQLQHPEAMGIFISSCGMDINMTIHEFRRYLKMLMRFDEVLSLENGEE